MICTTAPLSRSLLFPAGAMESGSELVIALRFSLQTVTYQGAPPTAGALGSGDRMVLVSDGVPEARTASGELYGFERLAGLTMLPAGEIAETAWRFGQEDDITVVSIACFA